MIDTDEALPILPRQLTTISDEVRQVPAPLIPHIAEPYAARVADPDADAELIQPGDELLVLQALVGQCRCGQCSRGTGGDERRSQHARNRHQ